MTKEMILCYNYQKIYLQASVGDLANLSGVEDLPGLLVESFVESVRSLRRCEIHETIPNIALVAELHQRKDLRQFFEPWRSKGFKLYFLYQSCCTFFSQDFSKKKKKSFLLILATNF